MSQPPPPPRPSPSSSSTSTADQVATCALRHYLLSLPAKKGKPQQPHEWTVFAAFIARHKIKRTCRCVASATGTKCTAIRLQTPQPQRQDGATATTATATTTAVGGGGGGCIVHDSHAEVLARRGLLRVLWSEIVSYYYDDQQQQQQQQHQKKKKAEKTKTKKTTGSEKTKEDTQGRCNQEGHTTTNHQKRDDPADTNDDDNNNSSSSSSSSSIGFLENLLVPVVSSPTSTDGVDSSTPSTTTTTTTTSSNGNSNSNVNKVKFKLDPSIELHLYISDSPCGDASIYEVKVPKTTNHHHHHLNNNAARKMDDDDDDSCTSSHSHLHPPKHQHPQQQQQQQGEVLLFTGAKVIVSKTTGVDVIKDCGGNHQLLSLGMNRNRNQNGNRNYSCGGRGGGSGNNEDEGGDMNDALSNERPTTTNHKNSVSIAREQHQVLGKLRTKAGRSNLPDHLRSNSMSCSDKIALWATVGVQGAFLTGFLTVSDDDGDDDNDDRPPIIPITSIVVGRDARMTNPNPDNDDEHLETASTGTSADNNNDNNNDDDDNNDDFTYNSQYLALERAIPTRVHSVLKTLCDSPDISHPFYCHVPKPPTVHISKHTFASGKSAMAVREQMLTATTTSDDPGTHHKGKKRKRDDGDSSARSSKAKIVPCGISINWNEADDRTFNSKKSSGSSSSSIEILVGARGIQQGKKPKSPKDYVELSSRLSRSRLVQDFVLKTSLLMDEESTADTPNLSSDPTYQSLKKQMSCSKWLDTKSKILNHPESPLAGWLRSSQEDNFAIQLD
mmetsp:Transcript_48887/g.118366  ORF Transcript_48887/g.118366 Transcript_48887/m.118366 type:complete len:782 (+) Transcript_48887:83-2428(+)